MPNWDKILREIAKELVIFKRDHENDGLGEFANTQALQKVRNKYFERLKKYTKRNTICYYSGFLTKPNNDLVMINDEDTNAFMLCMNGLEWDSGLDIILHTPGGDIHATIALIEYLRSKFGNNIRAIVPQISMSAGTMIACSCKEIVMGNQSSLGPVDPQFGRIAAANMLNEIKKAQQDISKNPNLSLFWNPILSQVYPSFIERCEQALHDSKEYFSKSLRNNMFSELDLDEQNARVENITEIFTNATGKAHNTHLGLNRCKEIQLRITPIEEDQTLQDLVLTLHHCYMHTFNLTGIVKIVENHLGMHYIKVAQV